MSRVPLPPMIGRLRQKVAIRQTVVSVSLLDRPGRGGAVPVLSVAQRPRRKRSSRSHRCLGFTLIELILAMSILLTLLSIAVPQYRGLKERALVTAAIGDLKTLEGEIMAFLAVNRVMPVDLAAIDRDGFLDPWGNPYEYLPFSTGISFFGGGGNGNGNGNGGGGGGPPAGARKDKFLVPVNADFDLYSKGADGLSAAPFTAAESRDDVVRAGSGGFFGLADDF